MYYFTISGQFHSGTRDDGVCEAFRESLGEVFDKHFGPSSDQAEDVKKHKCMFPRGIHFETDKVRWTIMDRALTDRLQFL